MFRLALFMLMTVSGVAQGVEDASSQADEQSQLEVVVAYDDLQRKLIQWDMELAGQYNGRGERELAEEKLASAGGRVEDVLLRYVLFLVKFPENAAAHNYYGEALADLKNNHAQAAQEWLKAIELDPQLPDPHNNMGIHYGHFGNPGKAIDEFRKAVELGPNVAEFHFDLALAYHNFRYVAMSKLDWTLPRLFEEILKESRTARKLNPEDLEIAADYARTFFSAQDFQVVPDWPEALSAWQYCLALTEDPAQRFNILLNLGRVALRMDRKKEAREYLNEALSIRPDSLVAKKLVETAQ
jgi:tetratricopeptide (TPR) repeat protein